MMEKDNMANACVEKITRDDIVHTCIGFDNLFKNIQEMMERLDMIHWKIGKEVLSKIEYKMVSALAILQSAIKLGTIDESDADMVKDVLCIGHAVYGIFEIKMGNNRPEYRTECDQHIKLADIAFCEFATKYGMISGWEEFHNAIINRNESIESGDNLMAN